MPSVPFRLLKLIKVVPEHPVGMTELRALAAHDDTYNCTLCTMCKRLNAAFCLALAPPLLSAVRAKSPMAPASPGFPFHIVAVGLEGESVLVPKPTGDVGDDLGEGDESTFHDKRSDEMRRDVISTSTLPFGESSLPTLASCCRQELQDRCNKHMKKTYFSLDYHLHVA